MAKKCYKGRPQEHIKNEDIQIRTIVLLALDFYLLILFHFIVFFPSRKRIEAKKVFSFFYIQLTQSCAIGIIVLQQSPSSRRKVERQRKFSLSFYSLQLLIWIKTNCITLYLRCDMEIVFNIQMAQIHCLLTNFTEWD